MIQRDPAVAQLAVRNQVRRLRKQDRGGRRRSGERDDAAHLTGQVIVDRTVLPTFRFDVIDLRLLSFLGPYKKQVVFAPLVDTLLEPGRATNSNTAARLSRPQVALEVMPRVRKLYEEAQETVPIVTEADINDQLYHLWFGPESPRRGPLQVRKRPAR